MNILIYAPQMATFGGMERHVCQLATVLAGRGHTATMLTTSNSLAAESRAALEAAGVSLRELPRNRGQASRLHKGLWLFREVLRGGRTPWDLIYTNGQSALARVIWLAAGRQTRIVHHHHTAADPREQATWSASFRRVLRRAPEIVACSQSTQRALAGALRRTDVTFLPYLTQTSIEDHEVSNRSYAPNTRLHFGFMGRLIREKGIDEICALSGDAAFADITWHLYGAGADYPPAHFASYPSVRYHGPYAPGAGQAAILRSLDALVLFSRHNEGMPLSLIEAMAAGLPWIATDQGGTRELAVSPANCLVVSPPFSPALLAAAVRTMADRIRQGATSRREQRAIYDRLFSAPAAAEAWCAYLEAGRPQPLSIS